MDDTFGPHVSFPACYQSGAGSARSDSRMLSAVILTKNEEKNITACLENLSLCDEVIVVDDNSTDKTVELGKKLGAKVFTHSLDNNFAVQRNFGLSKANGEWVLFIDGDERVSSALADEMTNDKLQMSNVDAYSVRRQDHMWGEKLTHGDVKNFKEVRLARKSVGKWKRKVHEYWDIKGKVGELKNPLLHYPHPTLAQFVSDLDFYSTLHAQQKFEEGERSNIIKIIVWPKLKFVHNYIVNVGFLDGTAGMVLAIIMSFHSFLAWSKLWLMSHEPLRK